ncbi:hypothetical protein V5P93_001295 [Actinokineospora auranticolor]|uniref:Uncharacterized protein n=1 Tax=Actinokineospora auranticolor TaxID=155976 RepID=A0A2S6GUQ2_9PSEU|nr:hypothetical protein [Actinokineospora auranticolor]PPK68923.1 hypothetical protein CLV40_104167 [Actinokineospora auranticolor]
MSFSIGLGRGRVVLATAVGVLGLAVAPAHAAVPADSSGSVGGGMAMFGGIAVDIGPLGQCAAGGPLVGTTPGTSDQVEASDAGLLGFGPGNSTCGFDPATGTASASASGRQFEVNQRRLGGVPVIKVATFSVSCGTTDKGGVKSSVSLAGVTGIDVPDDIPANYVIVVPGATPDDPPLANVVLNDTVEADPPDGSLSVHAIKIWFNPTNSPAVPTSGSITAGSVTCNPAH